MGEKIYMDGSNVTVSKGRSEDVEEVVDEQERKTLKLKILQSRHLKGKKEQS